MPLAHEGHTAADLAATQALCREGEALCQRVYHADRLRLGREKFDGNATVREAGLARAVSWLRVGVAASSAFTEPQSGHVPRQFHFW
jgi:hypothetical protein